MKTVFHALLIVPAFILLTAAISPNQYEAAMQAAIEHLFKSQSQEELQAVANTFERIGQKETDKWHPLYYGALSHIMMTFQIEDNAAKDQQLDLAKDLVEAGHKRSPNNSELAALEGFILMLRIPIDPATRGPQYSGMSMGALQKAVALNDQNPRAHMMLADMQFGMARFFGSDNSEGCATLKKALELFDSFEPASSLDPNWGKEWAEQNYKQCQ
ncbi:MAG: hypothetical protein R2824_25280 [Saprospiraceae bacterium]|nr:hypothetical protein [Lewinella sp.]